MGNVMDESRANLSKLFTPESIAIVGVSGKGFQFGGSSYLSRLLECGFKGRLYAINPRIEKVLGQKAYPTLEALPEVPDMAIICLAAKFVPDVLESCGRIGLRHIHILSSGFKETGSREGEELEARVTDISKRHGLLVIGPNCMGPYCSASRMTPFGASPGMRGPLGIISQSGGIAQRMTEYACSLNIGVEKAVSLGNAAVLDCCDLLKHMADDEKIKVIGMYLESVKDGRTLLELAKEVNREKPVIMLKGGDSDVGEKMAASHTGAISGGRKSWNAFFRQTGVTRVRSMTEWMDAIVAFSLLPAPAGKGVFIGCAGGGISVIAGDILMAEGLDVPALSETTMDGLRSIVPAVGSIVGNPLDSFEMSLNAHRFMEVLELVLEDPACSMILIDRLIPRNIYHLPDVEDTTDAVIDFVRTRSDRKPTVFSADYDGGGTDLALKGTEMRARFCQAGIPLYPSVKRAARSLMHLYRYHSFRQSAVV
ncbi:MAG: CoA-binding protein [Deltaproteobacteria bacterium]|nr:MAG: CoA-binding protein [Deltaproteobacteria bacterium]